VRSIHLASNYPNVLIASITNDIHDSLRDTYAKFLHHLKVKVTKEQLVDDDSNRRVDIMAGLNNGKVDFLDNSIVNILPERPTGDRETDW
jgi:hypothetical protein